MAFGTAKHFLLHTNSRLHAPCLILSGISQGVRCRRTPTNCQKQCKNCI